MGRFFIAAVVGLSGCAKHYDIRSVFAELTFPDKPPLPRDPNFELQAYSAAQLEFLTAWKSPAEVADCLRRFDSASIASWGAKLEAAAETEKDVETARALIADCGSLAAEDRPLLGLSLARYVLGVRSLARSTTATDKSAQTLAAASATALLHIGGVLDATPSIANTSHPALALSGGAANGAFTAGYLYELLLDRELALGELQPAPRLKADQQARFGTIVGTSVGSLQSQIVDLYFSSGAAPSPASDFFSRDAGYDPNYDADAGPRVEDGGVYELYPAPRLPEIAGRELQHRVLEILYRSFVTLDERTLICAENAPATALVGLLAESRPNLMRFDPMTINIIDPLLRAAAPQMMSNDVLTTVVAVDTMQNQLVGLDERMCVGLERDRGVPGTYLKQGTLEYCRSSGVMASVVLPFFARPVAHVYAGLEAPADANRPPKGSNGAWLDGGLRSTLPVYRALRATSPRPYPKDRQLRFLR